MIPIFCKVTHFNIHINFSRINFFSFHDSLKLLRIQFSAILQVSIFSQTIYESKSSIHFHKLFNKTMSNQDYKSKNKKEKNMIKSVIFYSAEICCITFRGFAFGRDFEAQKLILLLKFN